MAFNCLRRLPILLALLISAGCTAPILPATLPATGTPGAAIENADSPLELSTELENTQWQLVSFGLPGSEMPVREGATLTLTLAGGLAAGESGCNSFGGSYQVQNDVLVFGELVSTLMACDDEDIMQQEQQYLLALQSAGRFALTGDQLTIWYDDGNSQLSFVPAVTATLESPTTGDQTGAGMTEVAERVEFEPGVASATLSGVLPAGSDKDYALTAVAGQMLRVQAVSHAAPVSFTVYGLGGDIWTSEAQASDVNVFTAVVPVPETGDYLIILTAPADTAETTYDVTFTLEAKASQPMTPQPGPAQRIDFDPSTGSAQRSGLLPSGPGVEQFVLSLPADQSVTVDATSDGAPLSMTIAAPSGNQWIPEMVSTASGYTIGHQFTTPEGGYYLVTLTKGDHTPSTNYTITFAIQQ